MKVQVNNKEESNEIKFPCLMIHIDEKDILLAKKVNGAYLKCIVIDSDIHTTGKEVLALEDNLKPFKGTITLSND